MPFLNKSTLTYPATNSFPNGIWEDTRNPTSADFRSFNIGTIWINYIAHTFWVMVDRTATSGTWVQGASSGTGILTATGNSGGAVGPDGSNNINIIGSGAISIAGNSGTNTLTVTQSGAVATSFPTMSGTGIPSLGALTITGAGGVTTSASGSTVTITAGVTVPTSFPTDSGTATPVANILDIFGGTGITTSAINTNQVIITSVGGGIGWSVITASTQSMIVDHGYISNNAGGVTYTLPSTSAVGSVIKVTTINAGGWTIAQNAGQKIQLGKHNTTLGVGGSLASTNIGDTVDLVCTVANTTFMVLSSMGDITYV